MGSALPDLHLIEPIGQVKRNKFLTDNHKMVKDTAVCSYNVKVVLGGSTDIDGVLNVRHRPLH